MLMTAVDPVTTPFLTPAVVGLLIGAILTFAQQQFAAWRQGKRETLARAEERRHSHETWVLQQRYDAFFAYLEMVDAAKFRHYLKEKQDMSPQAVLKMQSIATRVGFVGSGSMKEVSMNLRTVLAELLVDKASVSDFETARNAYLSQARHELRTDL